MTPRFNVKTVLAWIGGVALAIWAVQLVISTQFSYAVALILSPLEPLVNLLVAQHLKQDEALIVVLAAAGGVVFVLAALTAWFGPGHARH